VRLALSRAAKRDGISEEAVFDLKKEIKEVAEVEEERRGEIFSRLSKEEDWFRMSV